ncbi:MAG: polysaccharide deacetylase family protein [Solirubrobacterales bacterium]
MTGDQPRDFVGYAESPPPPAWPGDARLALNVVVNWEEGAERNPMDGDLETEQEVDTRYIVPPGVRELYLESVFEYGSRRGIWRLLRTLDDFEIVPTVFACGLALERSPQIAREFARRGCDFVGHGYRWLPPTGLSREEELADIRRCVAAIEQTTGYEVKGWFARPPSTINTRSLVAEAGLLYDSGSITDDLPYYDEVAGDPLLVVPYSLDVNDSKYFKDQFFLAEDFSSYACDAFDALYREGAEAPRMLSVGLHPRLIGRPGRISGLARFLEHVRKHDDVWITGRDAIALHWQDRFPPPQA